MQAIESSKTYDVCIVGSGAAGGVAAHVLTAGGLDVVLLEAGPPLDPERDFKQHVWPYQLPHRGAGPGGTGDELMAPNGFWNIQGEPYTRAAGTRFNWFRSRIVGGRTNHWGRAALRFSEADFRPRSSDGRGENWPISYGDLKPYYDRVEAYIGVFGSHENIPSTPDGVFLPPPPPRCTERIIQNGCGRLGIPCVPSRQAILTRPHGGRPACHYCGQCGRGCKQASNFSSSQVLIPPALKTGRLAMITGAMAREVLVAKDGRARGVAYIDKASRTEREVRARAVVLGASACESARLLLNSRSVLFPQGLANSSGAVGRYLTDSVSSNGEGYFPQLATIPPHNHDGTGGMHLFIPWWKYERTNPFLRGYHIEFAGGRRIPAVGEFRSMCEEVQGYGLKLKETCRKRYGASIYFLGLGEMIPNERSFCELDPNVVDEWGIPVLRFHFEWEENDISMARDMQDTFREIVEAGGGTYVTGSARAEGAAGMPAGGETFHELGTARMGTNPATSVLNGFCQAHDVRNLFVTDAACFSSHPDKNPTLSILALSWRASEYLLDAARKGDL